MELFANDLSICRQFHDLGTFRTAILGLMAMREVAGRFGRDMCCHRTLVNVEPVRGMPMQQAIRHLSPNERRALMIWLTRGGPFWDEGRHHGIDDWMECRDAIVTDSAVGEAAFRTLHGIQCGLASATPSTWEFSPVKVIWRREPEELGDRITNLENWWDAATLEKGLESVPPPIRSWAALRAFSKIRFRSLTFADGCFDALVGVPFARGASERILVLLGILDRYAQAFDADGVRTPEGNQIYRDYFTGKKALFSDSSDAEKRDFQTKLTFPHPDDPGKSLFCTWHGKERHMTLRLHFSWPVRSGERVYVVYAGPKLTKR